MDLEISRRAEECRPLAVEILKEAIRIPADYVDRPASDWGDAQCGLSNHEGPRLEFLRRKVLEVGAADGPDHVGFDDFGNLFWTVQDPEDGIPPDEKVVVFMDGHCDTVRALRDRWREALGGIDPYLGLTDRARIKREFLFQELGYLPREDEWEHLVWGRGSADQLGGVVCQIMATKILRDLGPQGALRGVIVKSYVTVAEEDNDGGGPMFIMKSLGRHGESPHLPAGPGPFGAKPRQIPDAVILTEGTGCSKNGALGIYRGQRGRMQIEVVVTGKSCHGSMPWEGRNPLEYGAAIISEATAAYGRGEGFAVDDFLGPGTRTASFSALETPSDCAVPERFTFRFDRRLTAGEDPLRALRDVEELPAVAAARSAGLKVDVHVPVYDAPTWKGMVPGNKQIYPGWVTPEDHPVIRAAAEAYRRTASPLVPQEGQAGQRRKSPRVSRWTFSTDGVGFPVPRNDGWFEVPARKKWIDLGPFRYPAMFGIGPGIEQNTHKIGECVDSREIPAAVAVLARFPSLYREMA